MATQPPDTPHDALFRPLLSDPGDAAVLLREQLPTEIAGLMSDDPPRLLDGHFVDAHLRNSTGDCLFSVTLRTGRPAFLYVLLEHKSTPDPRTPLQVLGYMVRIWERHVREHPGDASRLPPILPLVLYHGQAPWRVPTSLLDSLDLDDDLHPVVRDFRYTVRDLGRMAPESLSAAPHVRAVLMALRIGTGDDAPLDRLVEIVAALPDNTLLERQVIRYILHVVARLTGADWHQVAVRAKPQREDAMVSLAAQEWMAQGRQQGLEQGLEQGRTEAMRESVAEVLESRFGRLPQATRDRLSALALHDLRPLLARAATAPTPEAVFDESFRH